MRSPLFCYIIGRIDIMNSIDIQYFDVPCGRLILGSYLNYICICDWMCNRYRESIDKRIQRVLEASFTVRPSAVIDRTKMELEEYFKGIRMQFDIPLQMIGTEFQKQVWQFLSTIPYGTTLSYGAEAEYMGRPSAVRAVANANGANPIAIVVPCHRVIGRNGALTGYAGGTDVKRYLLQLEQKYHSF